MKTRKTQYYYKNEKVQKLFDNFKAVQYNASLRKDKFSQKKIIMRQLKLVEDKIGEICRLMIRENIIGKVRRVIKKSKKRKKKGKKKMTFNYLLRYDKKCLRVNRLLEPCLALIVDFGRLIIKGKKKFQNF